MAMSICWLKRHSTELRNWRVLNPTLYFGNNLICLQFALSSEQNNFFFGHTMWISVLQPRIELGVTAMKAWNPNYCHQGTPWTKFLKNFGINVISWVLWRGGRFLPLVFMQKQLSTEGFPDGSEVKNLPGVQVRSLGQEDPLEKEWQPTPVFLPGGFHRQRSLAGYIPWGHKESDVTEWRVHWSTRAQLPTGICPQVDIKLRGPSFSQHSPWMVETGFSLPLWGKAREHSRLLSLDICHPTLRAVVVI